MSWLVSLLVLLAPVLPHDLRVSFARRIAVLLRDRIAGARPPVLAALARCQQRLTSLVLDIIVARACVLAGLRDDLHIRPLSAHRDPLSARRMVRHLSWLIARLDEVDALACDELARMWRDQMRARVLRGVVTAAPTHGLPAATLAARHAPQARALELSG